MTNWNAEPFGEGGILLRSRNGAASAFPQPANIHELLSRYGVIILRGFSSGLEDFSLLVQRSSDRISLDPLRPMAQGGAQLVDRGNHAIQLHCENGNCPWRPDLLWLYCRRPAAQGGATTLCDGAAVWKRLNAGSRTLFSERRILYRRPYPARSWRVFLPHLLPEDREVSTRSLRDLLDHTPGVAYRLNRNQTVFLEYRCSAVARSKFSNKKSFANSIHGPYPGQVVTLENGEPIPAEARLDIETAMAGLTQTISWQSGDMAIIDNTRFLHGRQAFSGKEREVFAALSFV